MIGDAPRLRQRSAAGGLTCCSGSWMRPRSRRIARVHRCPATSSGAASVFALAAGWPDPGPVAADDRRQSQTGFRHARPRHPRAGRACPATAPAPPNVTSDRDGRCDYQGRRHTVTVEPDGYVWEGNPYSSLSAIARAITGTAWSGPRFFAVKSSGDRKNDPPDAAPGQRRTRHPTEPQLSAGVPRPGNPARARGACEPHCVLRGHHTRTPDTGAAAAHQVREAHRR